MTGRVIRECKAIAAVHPSVCLSVCLCRLLVSWTPSCHDSDTLVWNLRPLVSSVLLASFHGAIAVPSVTRCRCCRRRRRCFGHRCTGSVRQWWRATVATPGEWQCGMRRLTVANGPSIFQMLLVLLCYFKEHMKMSVVLTSSLPWLLTVDCRLQSTVTTVDCRLQSTVSSARQRAFVSSVCHCYTS